MAWAAERDLQLWCIFMCSFTKDHLLCHQIMRQKAAGKHQINIVSPSKVTQPQPAQPVCFHSPAFFFYSTFFSLFSLRSVYCSDWCHGVSTNPLLTQICVCVCFCSLLWRAKRCFGGFNYSKTSHSLLLLLAFSNQSGHWCVWAIITYLSYKSYPIYTIHICSKYTQTVWVHLDQSENIPPQLYAIAATSSSGPLTHIIIQLIHNTAVSSNGIIIYRSSHELEQLHHEV